MEQTEDLAVSQTLAIDEALDDVMAGGVSKAEVAALTADFYRSLLAGAGRASSADIAAQASSTPMSRQDSQEFETRK